MNVTIATSNHFPQHHPTIPYHPKLVIEQPIDDKGKWSTYNGLGIEWIGTCMLFNNTFECRNQRSVYKSKPLCSTITVVEVRQVALLIGFIR
jgi:hypothetical protein